MLANKIIVIVCSIITYLVATQMGAILDAMQKALSLAIGTSFIVIGGLFCPRFTSKSRIFTILISIASIILWNIAPSIAEVFKNIGFFMLFTCSVTFIGISIIDKDKIEKTSVEGILEEA